MTVGPEKIASQPGAKSETGHKRGEDDGNKCSGDTELRHAQAKPYQFIENTAETRNKEENKITAQWLISQRNSGLELSVVWKLYPHQNTKDQASQQRGAIAEDQGKIKA